MDYGQALDAAKSGNRIVRAGWNGKNMWVALTPAHVIPAREEAANLRGAAQLYALLEDVGDIKVCAHLDMRAADGSLVIGWLASQTDMLAEDWEVLSPLPFNKSGE